MPFTDRIVWLTGAARASRAMKAPGVLPYPIVDRLVSLTGRR